MLCFRYVRTYLILINWLIATCSYFLSYLTQHKRSILEVNDYFWFGQSLYYTSFRISEILFQHAFGSCRYTSLVITTLRLTACRFIITKGMMLLRSRIWFGFTNCMSNLKCRFGKRYLRWLITRRGANCCSVGVNAKIYIVSMYVSL